MNTKAKFRFNNYYHVYNRTNNKDYLFKSDNNFKYFLKKVEYYLSGYTDILAYSLLHNHFHLCLSVKNEPHIVEYIETIHPKDRSQKMKSFLGSSERKLEVDSLVISQFRRLFISYSQAFNKMHNRSGHLWNRPFKRILIDNKKSLMNTIYYTHHNARKHGLYDHFEDHKWHSYNTFLSGEKTFLSRNKVYEIFGDKDTFIDFHNRPNV